MTKKILSEPLVSYIEEFSRHRLFFLSTLFNISGFKVQGRNCLDQIHAEMLLISTRAVEDELLTELHSDLDVYRNFSLIYFFISLLYEQCNGFEETICREIYHKTLKYKYKSKIWASGIFCRKGS